MNTAVALILFVFILLLAYFAWIRRWQLTWGARQEELARPMPGDEIVARPSFDATRAVTIHAPAAAIYPWIVQMGLGRAGWYSYDLLDNLGRHSAERLLPEHQQICAGQLIPISPDGKQGLFVKEFREPDSILWWDQVGLTSWYWGIYPEGEGGSRLVTRLRMHYRWQGLAGLFCLLVEFTDIIMMRKCMLGIKRRAEA